MAFGNPTINGNLHAWSSIEIDLGGRVYDEFTSISYDHEVEQEVMMGTGQEGLGYTDGGYKATGEFEMALHAADEFLAQLGSGYSRVSFNIGITYVENPGAGLSSIEILGARINKVSHSIQRGAAGAVKKFSFQVVKAIRENGITMIDTERGGIDAAVSAGISLIV